MLTIISPSKTQDFESIYKQSLTTIPKFIDEACYLSNLGKKLTKSKIEKLMNISAKLAESTYNKFQNFPNSSHDNENSKPALFTYTGDVYNAMNVSKYMEKDIEFAQANLRIVSGLYGLLKPTDLIHPYRLEMGIKLQNSAGSNLYDFWQSKLTREINEILANHSTPALINLASIEYSSSINFAALKGKYINITFKENRNGKLQIIGLLAKKARGMMADFIITNKIDDPERLKEFKMAGYNFIQDLSSDKEFIFVQ